MLPLFPVLALIAFLGGAGALAWYDSLDAVGKEEANEWTAHYAQRLYRKTVAELTREEAQLVHRMTRGHFN